MMYDIMYDTWNEMTYKAGGQENNEISDDFERRFEKYLRQPYQIAPSEHQFRSHMIKVSTLR